MIIIPLKRNWWILTICTIICAVLMGFIKNEKTVRIILWTVALANFIYFYIYKYFLLRDEAFAKLLVENGYDKPNPYCELFPLQFCNSAVFTIPLFLLTGSRAILAYAALGLPVCTMLGLTMPCLGFEKYDFRLPRINGFYMTHYFPLFMGLSFWTTGMYVPEYKDVLYFMGCMLLNILLAHVVNRLIRHFTEYKKTNYFFTMSPDGTGPLEFFYKLIPVPFFYSFPAIIVFGIGLILIISIYKLIALLI